MSDLYKVIRVQRGTKGLILLKAPMPAHALEMEPGQELLSKSYNQRSDHVNSLLPIAIVSVHIDSRPTRASNSDLIQLDLIPTQAQLNVH